MWILLSAEESVSSNTFTNFHRSFVNKILFPGILLQESRLLSKNLKIKIYKTIILPVALCGCEAWSLTSREECRLRIFEKRILR